jgi:putative FmdB family regulatory protein
MPLYEWQCAGCGLTFEALAGLAERARKRRCPACARPARRVISNFSIAGSDAAGSREIDALTRPLAPTLPPAARFCWMNDQAAERFAAYRTGRGTEYDDRQARASELRKQRVDPAVKPAAPKGKRRAARESQH